MTAHCCGVAIVVVCDTGVMELEQFRDEAAQRTNQFITDADRPWTQSARAWDLAVEAAIGEPITIDGYAIQTPLRASGAHRAQQDISRLGARLVGCAAVLREARDQSAVGRRSCDWPTDGVARCSVLDAQCSVLSDAPTTVPSWFRHSLSHSS